MSTHDTTLPRGAARALALAFAVLAFAGVPGAARAQDGLSHFRVMGCTAEMTSKIWTALHYVETIAFDNDDFLYCASDAARGVEPLTTRQEFTAVGPYVPCNTTDPALREPASAYVDPIREVSFARTYLEDAFADDYPAIITIQCTGATSYTARTGARFAPGHRSGYTIEVGLDPQWSRPDHQPLTGSALPDVGPTFDHTAAEWSYPVDELAGILAHEILHTHGYSHGDGISNQCGYTSYDCAGSAAGTSCRANSMLEIIEACVSEVAERSIAVCSGARWANRHPVDPGGRRIVPLVESGTCRNFPVLSDARDGRGLDRTEFETDVDRYGYDYAAITTASEAACRTACLQDWYCLSFTYLPANDGCYLKASVPAPSRRSGAISGVVRVNNDSFITIEPWSRFPNTTSSGTVIQTVATTASDCEQRCLADVRCRVYTHDGAQCRLRSTTGTFSTLAGTTAVEVRTSAYIAGRRLTTFNAHHPIAAGWTMTGLGDGGYEACVEWCHSDPECQGFNFFPDGHCDFELCDPTIEVCDFFGAPVVVPGGVGYYR